MVLERPVQILANPTQYCIAHSRLQATVLTASIASVQADTSGPGEAWTELARHAPEVARVLEIAREIAASMEPTYTAMRKVFPGAVTLQSCEVLCRCR